MHSSLPAEKKHYRKGLALGLTIAETFSIIVFILLLACAVLLRFEQIQRDGAEAERDTARVDLLITQEMVRSDSMSWGRADAWFERSRELVREREVERLRAETAERNLASATARAAEAERQLQNEGATVNRKAPLREPTRWLARRLQVRTRWSAKPPCPSSYGPLAGPSPSAAVPARKRLTK